MTKNRVKSNADLEEIVNLVYDMNRGAPTETKSG